MASKVKKEVAVAKREEMTPAILKETFGDVTGTNVSGFAGSFPYIIVLQSDKTFKQFVDGNTITTEQFGKMFIRTTAKNHSSDLRSMMSGILVKEQLGSEMWVNGKLVYSSDRYLSEGEKQDLIAKYKPNSKKGERPNNMIKLLIKFDKPYILASGDELEYGIFAIKGTNFPSHNDMRNQQKLLLATAKMRVSPEQVPVVLWHLDISTVLTTGDYDIYNVKFDVKMNDFATSKKYAEDMLKANSLSLFTAFAPTEEDEAIEEVFKDEVQPAKEAEIVDADDLPFDSKN
jgi:hypothetical protein